MNTISCKSIRRMIPFLTAGCLLTFSVFAAYSLAVKPAGLESFPIRTPKGFLMFDPDTQKQTVIVLVSSECLYCRKQIYSSLKAAESVENKISDLLILSSDRDFFRSSVYRLTVNAELKQNFITGIISETDRSYLFGNPPVPATLVYGRDGKCKKMIKGIINEREFAGLLKSETI